MDCRDAYRFVRCGFVYVNVCYGAAQPCCRALVMLPRTLMLPLIRGAAFVYAARAAKWSQVLCVAALHSAAHLYVAARPWCRACGQMVSSSLCAASHVAAQFYMLPRPMVPRGRPNGLSSLYCRVPWCRAGGQMVSVLCVAASHGAAQFYM